MMFKRSEKITVQRIYIYNKWMMFKRSKKKVLYIRNG